MKKPAVGILTISDRSSQGLREDLAGPLLSKIITDFGWDIKATRIINDDLETIKQSLIQWIDESQLDLILTTGGTGFAPRDNTPEATLAVIERETQGLVEAMRNYGMRKTSHAMLSRAVAGIRNRTLIINLPGNPKGAAENLEYILPVLPHALELLADDPHAEKEHHAGDM